MARPTPTSTLDVPSHSKLHAEPLSITMFDDDAGSGGDDTAALEAVIAESQDSGGTVFLPAPSSGSYNITSTIDLSDVILLHVVGGQMQPSGWVYGQQPPAVVIDGSTITAGAVFYCNRAGTFASHVWENLGVYGGRTGFHYVEASNIQMNNVAAKPQIVDGNVFNVAVVMQNSFFANYRSCNFHGPLGTENLPAVLLYSSSPLINGASGAHFFEDCIFWNGGVTIHKTSNSGNPTDFNFTQCITENAAVAMVTITEGTITNTDWRLTGMYLRQCGHADLVASSPLVNINAAHCNLDGAVVTHCVAPNGHAIKVTAANSVQGTFIDSYCQLDGSAARYSVNAAGTATGGNTISIKNAGLDIIGDDTVGPLFDDPLQSAGPALRFARPGDTKIRHGIASDGKHHWGSGSAAYDTTLYRNAVDELKTDDKFLAAAGIGVGNSAAATTSVGALARKIEVFDASGASLGFIPVYSTIT